MIFSSFIKDENKHLKHEYINRLKVRGTWLTEILGDNDIDTIGLQTASVDVNHIHKSRYSVQLSVVAIYACLKEAYDKSKSDLPLFEWADDMSRSNHMFKYWLLILKFQINYLVFVRALREGDFTLFLEVIQQFVKCFFIFDQLHYARWISVHVQDLLSLDKTCPEVYDQFKNGNFVLRKDENFQRRWEIAGPRVAQYIDLAESKFLMQNHKTLTAIMKITHLIIRCF